MLSIENFNIKTEILEIYGFALGDGWITNYRYFRKDRNRYEERYRLQFAGSKKTLNNLQKTLRNLGYGSYIYEKKRTLIVSSRTLPKTFIKWGFPLGYKPTQEYNLPEFIDEVNKEHKKAILRGLFGADGSKPSLAKNGRTFWSIFYTIVKENKPRLISSGENFLFKILELLREFGIEASEHIVKTKNGDKVTLRLFIYGEDNIYNFLTQIGYAYDAEKIKFAKKARKYLQEKLQIRKKFNKQRVYPHLLRPF